MRFSRHLVFRLLLVAILFGGAVGCSTVKSGARRVGNTVEGGAATVGNTTRSLWSRVFGGGSNDGGGGSSPRRTRSRSSSPAPTLESEPEGYVGS